MDIQTLKEFFLWCSLINVSLFAVWMGAWTLAPDLVYRTQTMFFPMQRESFDVIFYKFLGYYKILFLYLNFIPWMALIIIA